MDSMTYVINAAYAVALMFLAPWLVIRSLMTGRYRQGLSQKLVGLSFLPDDDGRPVAWFHGVSVGEINLLGTVVAAFRKRHPDYRCVVSCTTDTGMSEARKRFADLTVIYWPFDFSWAVKRTLDALQPKLVVLAESELWPNFLRIALSKSVPVVIINGRMSPKSAARYAKLGRAARSLLLDRVTRFAMQSSTYADALTSLGIPAGRVAVTGSVKYDGAPSDRGNTQSRQLAARLGIRPDELLFVAGSTHAPEEEVLLDVFRRLRVRHEKLRLVLVPRSPDRFDDVARMLERASFSYCRRSKLTAPPTDAPAVILLDTIGELNAAWGLADIGFTGGSLDGKRGGQSMIEPAGLGVPVVFGPHVWNFRDAAARLIEAGAAFKVDGAATMRQQLERLLDDAELRQSMGRAARELVVAQQGATGRTLDLLDDVLGVHVAVRRAA